MNGPFVSGIVELSAVRYEIRTHIERNDNGDVIDISYGYAAAIPEDISYEHIGIHVDASVATDEELELDPLEINPFHRSLLRKAQGASLENEVNAGISVDLQRTIAAAGDMKVSMRINFEFSFVMPSSSCSKKDYFNIHLFDTEHYISLIYTHIATIE